MNILEIIREQLSPEIVGQISKSAGESPEGTKSALQSALPTLLGSAAAQAATPNGATGLLDLIKQKTPAGGWSESVSGLLGSAGGGGSAGSSFVSSLLGPKMNMVRDFIANRSGIRSESATSLMGMGGQMLMGILGKQVSARGLGASGLGQLLSSQIPHLKGLVPPELSNMLGIGNFLGQGQQSLSDAIGQVTPAMQHARTSGANALKWAAIPLAVLLAVLFVVYRHNRQSNVGGTRDETLNVQNTGLVTGASTPQSDIQSFADQAKTAIASGESFELRGTSFDNSGNLSADAQTKLSQLGKLMSENPALQVTVTTYGATADEAASKANAIKSGLIKMGVGPEKVVTQSELGEGLPKIRFAK
jgi:hypothetical protein